MVHDVQHGRKHAMYKDAKPVMNMISATSTDLLIGSSRFRLQTKPEISGLQPRPRDTARQILAPKTKPHRTFKSAVQLGFSMMVRVITGHRSLKSDLSWETKCF